MTDSKGNHLETEQKYNADANFVRPKLGDLPGALPLRSRALSRWHGAR